MTTSWMVLVIGLWAVVLALMALLLGFNRRIREMSEALSSGADPSPRVASLVRGPKVGSAIRWPTSSPSTATRSAPTPARRGRIVLFLSFSCGPCHALGDELNAAQEDGFAFTGSDLVIVTDELGATLFDELRPDELVVQTENEISQQLGINATPYGVAVDADGVVRWSGVANRFDDIVSMVAAVGAPAD